MERELQLERAGKSQLEKSSSSDPLVDISVYQVELEQQNEHLRHAQLQIEQARDAYMRLYDLSPIGHLTLDVHGTILQCNQTFAMLVGTDSSVIPNRPLVDFVCERERSSFLTCFQSFFRHPVGKCFETALLSNRSRRIVSIVGRKELSLRVPFPEGESEYVLLLAIHDITEQIEAERALRESEEKFRLIVETTTDMIFQIDRRAVMTYVSPGALGVVGWLDAEMEGTLFTKYIAPVSMDDAMTAFEQVLDGSVIADLELQTLRPDRTLATITVSVAPVHRDGEVVGLQGIAREISERRRISDELSRSNAELEQFAYAVSHDLRQPLRMVNSYLQLLTRELEGQLSEQAQEYIHFATDGAVRMDQMILSLLTYSRVGRKGELKVPIDSSVAFEEAMSYLRPDIEAKNARIAICGTFPVLIASRDELVRLFQNLLTNALKYQREEHQPEIQVSVSRQKREVIFAVSDNGIGIDPSQKHRLFQVFSRLQSRSRYEGTGLGLAICRKIAEHHGGRIWVESAGEGTGCTFFVAFPVADVELRV